MISTPKLPRFFSLKYLVIIVITALILAAVSTPTTSFAAQLYPEDVPSLWSFKYDTTNAGSSDPIRGIRATATKNGETTDQEMFIIESAQTGDSTRYNGSQNHIEVDCATRTATLFFPGEGDATITVTGTSSAPQCADEEGDEGSVSVTINLGNLHKALEIGPVGPILVTVVPESGGVEGQATIPTMLQGSDQENTQFVSIGGIPAGTYDVNVIINDVIIGSKEGVNIRSGKTVNVSINATASEDGIFKPGDVSAAADEQRGGCESTAINLPFSLLICPIVEILFDAVDFMYSKFILPELAISPLDAGENGSDESKALFGIWNNFRFIANILFIGIFLIAVIGQSFSIFFTSYEIKKIIPRLAIGIIAVQLSWWICSFFVDVFNVMGTGVRSLMLAPLDGLDANVNFNFGLVDNITSGIVTGAGTGIVLFTVGITGLLYGIPLILAPIVVALLATYMTVLLRKVLIFILIVSSPIAFVMWILPGTDKIYKAWWGLFWKALFVYPIIIALMSGGEFMGRVITATEGEGVSPSISQSLVGMIALFGPYFAIPSAFKFAGGALAGISGGVDKWGKGFVDKKFGDARDPNSMRGRRLAMIRSKRSSRTANLIEGRVKLPFVPKTIAHRAAGKSGVFMSALANRRLNINGKQDGGYRGLYDKAINTALPNAMDLVGQEYDKAKKRVDDMTSNGPDNENFAKIAAVLGMSAREAQNLFNDGDITEDSIARAKGHLSDYSSNVGMAAALTYSFGKTNSEAAAEKLYNNFLENDGLGASKEDREKILDLSVNDGRVMTQTLGLKHAESDHNGGTRIKAGKDEEDFFSQMNGTKYGNIQARQKSLTWRHSKDSIDRIMRAGAITHLESQSGGAKVEDSAVAKLITQAKGVDSNGATNRDASGNVIAPNVAAARAIHGALNNQDKRSFRQAQRMVPRLSRTTAGESPKATHARYELMDHHTRWMQNAGWQE